MMVIHLLRVSVRGKIQVIIDSISYLIGWSRWRISLAIIRPLNYMRESQALTAVRKRVCKNYFTEEFIEAPLPFNLESRDNKIFSNNYYLLHPLKIISLKNQWVYLTNYHGIVLKNFSILRESIHGKWDKRNVAILKDYYPHALKSWMYAYHEQSDNLIELNDNNKYLLCHHWFNYYHWMTETILRIWTIREDLNDYSLILPESFRTIEFVQQSLAILSVTNVRYVKEGVLHVKDLTIVQNKPYCNHYNPATTKQIGMFFRDHVNDKTVSIPDIGERIYISRKKADRRKLVNEEEVECILLAHHFITVCIEEFNFLQQVAIFSKAKYLVGMHGAGLTNMLYMQEGGSVLELHRKIYSNDDLYSDVYWKLASALGHHYYYQFCEAERREEDFFTANYIVDTEKLKENLRLLVS